MIDASGCFLPKHRQRGHSRAMPPRRIGVFKPEDSRRNAPSALQMASYRGPQQEVRNRRDHTQGGGGVGRSPGGSPPALRRRAAGEADGTDESLLSEGALAEAAWPRSQTAGGGRARGRERAPVTGTLSSMTESTLDLEHSPPGRQIYSNRTLNLRTIRAIGYDMDYTLVHYRADVWEQKVGRSGTSSSIRIW